MEGEGCACWMCYDVLNVKAIQDVLEKTYFKFTPKNSCSRYIVDTLTNLKRCCSFRFFLGISQSKIFSEPSDGISGISKLQDHQNSGPKLLNGVIKGPTEMASFLWKKWMFPKMGFSPQIIHFNKGFHYFHHPFWGKHPYFWKHPNIALLLFVGPPLDLIFFFLSQCEACSEQAWEGGGKWMGFQHRECRL